MAKLSGITETINVEITPETFKMIDDMKLICEEMIALKKRVAILESRYPRGWTTNA